MLAPTSEAPEHRTDEPDEPDGPGGPGTAAAVVPVAGAAVPGRRRRWPQVVLGVLAACGLAGTVGFGLAWSHGHAQAAEAAQVRSTSGEFLLALTNFDPGTVAADFSRIDSYAVGAFASQAHQFFSGAIRSQLASAKAASRGKVADLYVQSLDGSSASVYAVVDQSYLNAYLRTPTTDTLRMVLGLKDTSKGWRIASVDVLPATTGASPAPGSSPKQG